MVQLEMISDTKDTTALAKLDFRVNTIGGFGVQDLFYGANLSCGTCA